MSVAHRFIATLPERFADVPKLTQPYVEKNLRAVTEAAFRPAAHG